MIKSSNYDLAFIGSGISSTFTIYQLLNRIKDENDSNIMQIAIIDKYPEFHSGIAYGNRSGHTTLLITSLKNFLPEPYLSRFSHWLTNNKKRLLHNFEIQGGPLSQKWINQHKEELKNNDWGDLYIPRRFFGLYIEENINSLIKELEDRQKIKVTYINDKVNDAKKSGNLWEIILKKQNSLFTTKLILSIGSPPTKYLWNYKSQMEKNKFLLINDPYDSELGETLKTIKEFIQKNKDIKPNVAIIGANASGLEMLYQMNDHPEIGENINHFYLLSSQGLLPDSTIDDLKLKQFRTVYLDSLALKKSITAQEIAGAVYKDLDLAAEIQLGAASTVGIISQKFGQLLNKLNHEELSNFACFHGNQIGRRQRCAGKHYADTINLLEDENKIDHLAGRFEGLLPGPNGNVLLYRDRKGDNQRIKQSINLVINCTGGMQLNHPKVPKILHKLIRNGIIIPNESLIGIKVDDELQASHNFHVIGPLLAGNVIENKAVWHVEHCGRIIWLSELLSRILNKKTNNQMNVKLEVLYLDDEDDLDLYKNLIEKEWKNHPYYLLDYLSHHFNGSDRLIAFNFLVDSKSMVIMPMVLREIKITEEQLFDVISPYGYSGPLSQKGLSFQIMVSFWMAVDQWYRKNKVVSEFVRFHLNGNQLNYSGQIVPTLDNVYGNLSSSFEDQWNSFLSKVRNNYRKAVKAELTITIYKDKEITKDHVSDFYNIYLSTMKRNEASKELYFSLEHFEKLVLNNSENFGLVFVKSADIPISTELIILLDDCIYGYLGGTLSEYFSCRPNDFLRVEVIRWGINESKKHYILGGGITNGDGLYKYKKSLFPNCPDKTYYTGRKIIDSIKYKELSSMVSGSGEELEDEHYFPLYRKKNI